jgi:hypothetical protein
MQQAHKQNIERQMNWLDMQMSSAEAEKNRGLSKWLQDQRAELSVELAEMQQETLENVAGTVSGGGAGGEGYDLGKAVEEGAQHAAENPAETGERLATTAPPKSTSDAAAWLVSLLRGD